MNLELHTTFPEHLKAEWNALLDESVSHVPFLRHEYLSAWWQTRGGGEWPPEAQLAVVTARQDGRLAAVAPLFHAPDFKGRPALMFLGSVEISDYLDFIVRPADLQPFLSELLPFLRAADLPEWQALDLYNLLDPSPSPEALKAAAAGLGWEAAVEQAYHAPCIPLPGDWEAYLASIDKKQRHEIRRKVRKAEAGPLEPAWYLVEDESTLEEEIDAFLGMMAQDPSKQEFLTEPMRAAMRQIMRCAFEEGCLHLAVLTFVGQRAAAYLSFDYLNRLWVYNSGWDSRFGEYSPGWVLLAYLLQWANENGREAFDFMRGDEEYKYRFGGVDRAVLRVVVTPEEKA
ncbi:MAG TPA: GNAT family N-acetyltransferase [Anaerolineaceae bacterium]|nr:GNAT family N-acetyltransferase [Anaerolineaceae bacterium]